jgi:hypothetical protein
MGVWHSGKMPQEEEEGDWKATSREKIDKLQTLPALLFRSVFQADKTSQLASILSNNP